MAVLLRRRKLGKTSCKGIAAFARNEFVIVRNDLREVPPGHTHIFRWGCTANVPHGSIVVNKAESMHLVSDKRAFRAVLEEHELCPKTWFSIQEALRAPVIDFVVRPGTHAQGRHIYRCRTSQELTEAVRICGPEFYISEYIDKVAEYRVFVCNGRAVWVAQKTPGNPEDLAWNVARGGRFDNVRWDQWPLKVIKVAIEAYKLSGLDFGGVDVMVDEEGGVCVLEINAAPSQTSEYRQTCTAKVFDYVVDNGLNEIPLSNERGGYRKFIHPAICERAIV